VKLVDFKIKLKEKVGGGILRKKHPQEGAFFLN
jgi:hypothetical protein